MAYNIKFSVHRNPLKDGEGNDTFQVRHETSATVDKEYLLSQIKNGIVDREVLSVAIDRLQKGIVNQLMDNHRLHIEGLGTFFLKLGFRKRYDEQGQELKIRFTDPEKITGNDVIVESVGFTPDKNFMKLFNAHGCHFINATGRGTVGHSAQYTEEQIKHKLDKWFEHNEHITRTAMQGYFGLTKYMAQKWLEQLTTQPVPYLVGRKVGPTILYQRVKR